MRKHIRILSVIMLSMLLCTACTNKDERYVKRLKQFSQEYRAELNDIVSFVQEQNILNRMKIIYEADNLLYYSISSSEPVEKHVIMCDDMALLFKKGFVHDIVTDHLRGSDKRGILMFNIGGYGNFSASTDFVLYYSTDNKPVCLDCYFVYRDIPLIKHNDGWIITDDPEIRRRVEIRNLQYYTEQLTDHWFFAIVKY